MRVTLRRSIGNDDDDDNNNNDDDDDDEEEEMRMAVESRSVRRPAQSTVKTVWLTATAPDDFIRQFCGERKFAENKYSYLPK